MGKLILGILMIVLGLMGLTATICGVVFLPMQGIGLIGILPGALLMWAAWVMWKSYRASVQSSAAPARSSDHPD